jgi:ABC-type transport system involved in multi-copper enzyme maturation permease subunit
VGILRGELFKISRQRAAWVATILLGGLLCAPYLVYLAGRGIGDALSSTPLDVMYTLMQRDLQVLRAFGGIYLLIISALVVGQEYQLGTIRILLGRGVGRLQLLGAKVLALVIVALGVLVAALVLDSALAVVDLLILAHSLSAFSALTAAFWSQTGWYILTVAISMGATLLLGVAANVVGRSLAFGLGVGLIWFPADNIGTIIMSLIAQFTNNPFWNNITGFFLGPTLNVLPALIVPARVITGPLGQTASKPASTLGIPPLVSVTSTQAILVIVGYCVVFAAIAIYLTWRRDVLE